MKISFNWVTVDACGGISYGPYSRREAFDIQRRMQHYEDSAERQDVFLRMHIITSDNYKEYRLLRFKGHYVPKRGK